MILVPVLNSVLPAPTWKGLWEINLLIVLIPGKFLNFYVTIGFPVCSNIRLWNKSDATHAVVGWKPKELQPIYWKFFQSLGESLGELEIISMKTFTPHFLCCYDTLETQKTFPVSRKGQFISRNGPFATFTSPIIPDLFTSKIFA